MLVRQFPEKWLLAGGGVVRRRRPRARRALGQPDAEPQGLRVVAIDLGLNRAHRRQRPHDAPAWGHQVGLDKQQQELVQDQVPRLPSFGRRHRTDDAVLPAELHRSLILVPVRDLFEDMQRISSSAGTGRTPGRTEGGRHGNVVLRLRCTLLRQLLAELPQQQKDTNGLGCVLPLGRPGECPIGRPSLRTADGAACGLRREAAQVGASLLDAGWPRAVRLPLLRENVQKGIRQGALQVRPHVLRRRPQGAPRRAASGLQPSRLPGAAAAVNRRASVGGHREDELHERLKHHHPQ
mmetsp:Transcript_72048/g.182153  ORF Transcript_72048/g.182153 Transcript_72048/m.182153 type:complete len:294 (-) Transcript_72048:9-890(-)